MWSWLKNIMSLSFFITFLMTLLTTLLTAVLLHYFSERRNRMREERKYSAKAIVKLDVLRMMQVGTLDLERFSLSFSQDIHYNHLEVVTYRDVCHACMCVISLSIDKERKELYQEMLDLLQEIHVKWVERWAAVKAGDGLNEKYSGKYFEKLGQDLTDCYRRIKQFDTKIRY